MLRADVACRIVVSFSRRIDKQTRRNINYKKEKSSDVITVVHALLYIQIDNHGNILNIFTTVGVLFQIMDEAEKMVRDVVVECVCIFTDKRVSTDDHVFTDERVFVDERVSSCGTSIRYASPTIILSGV
jgi:hypothetical protein